MTGARREPFLAWPGGEHLKFAAGRILLVSLWFALIFGGADWLTAQRVLRVRIHMDWELGLPLLPEFTLAYMSIYAVFLAVPFVLRTRLELESLAREQATAIALAGVGFLLLPADLAYAPPANLGGWEPLFRFADWLNLDHNLVPSLHVALSVICLEHFAPHATTTGAWLLRGWGVLIAVSTLLTHQHHFLDVVMGYALALGVVWQGRRTELHLPCVI